MSVTTMYGNRPLVKPSNELMLILDWSNENGQYISGGMYCCSQVNVQREVT